MFKQYILLAVAGLMVLLGSMGTSHGEKPDVQVPVVLDEVRYEPSEFNQIYEELADQGVKLWFVVTEKSVKEGVLYAFTLEAGFREFDPHVSPTPLHLVFRICLLAYRPSPIGPTTMSTLTVVEMSWRLMLCSRSCVTAKWSDQLLYSDLLVRVRRKFMNKML